VQIEAAPSTGQIVRVRSRQYLVEDVVPPPKPGDDTLIRLSCLDDDARGEPLEVLWEHEVDGEILSASSMMRVAERGFDDPAIFSAYLHTLRWSCVTATNPKLLQAPYRAGIEVMAYQLEPLRKALLLPRVNLFIADDVGLGKTIEAGLILRELMLRQKVRRVVVAVPPSVVLQWRDELEQRFGLTCVVFDRDYVLRKRRERGFGINPFTTHSRFIISHALLRDEAYASLLRDWITNDDHLLPELREPAILILDEAHNAAPASGSKYAIDSKFTKVVREIAPLFEHRLFLSATPHNGHSNSFSALLEILDPQRFCRGVRATKKHVEAAMVRRLKDDLRQIGLPGFPRREVIQVDLPAPGQPPLPDDAPELALARLLDVYGQQRDEKLEGRSKTEKAAARLIITSLQKRLLSSIEAFACTLRVHRRGLEKKKTTAAAACLLPSESLDLFDDRDEDEVEADEASAIEAASNGEAAAANDLLDEMTSIAEAARGNADARVDWLVAWIRRECLEGDRWNARRVLIFTEYTDTKRYLEEQLASALARTDRAAERIATFTGGMSEETREELKRAFNASPAKHPLRILIATDAAREGVNLQNHCADIFHFDVPWNPSRMEQRNGRIDRKLQRAEVVRCHYFLFSQRPEDDVLKTLVEKTRTIQEELGSLAPVLEARLGRILEGGIRRKDLDRIQKAILDEGIDAEKRTAASEELDDATRLRRDQLKRQLDELRDLMANAEQAIGFREDRFRAALSAGLSIFRSRPLEPMEDGVWRIPSDSPLLRDATWNDTLDLLRAPRKKGEKLWDWRKASPIRPVVFEDVGSLDDAKVHLHLEHRLVQRILGRFLAQGFVQDDITRAVAVLSKDPVPRVVLLGRVSLFGEHGSRLHDEIVAVAARWSDPDGRKDALKPYGDDTTEKTLRLVEEALASARAAPDTTKRKLVSGAERDFFELEAPLREVVSVIGKKAELELEKRGEREAKEMLEILETQNTRIRARLAETEGPKLDSAQAAFAFFTEEERRQLHADQRHWKKRLADLELELEHEPKRVREGYRVRARRMEPVGLVYLWPTSG
jgi:superfamily II DNA or RNA helicase